LNASASISAKLDSGALWQKQLVVNMVDMLLPTRLVEVSASPGIELVSNWQGRRLIVNLINHAAAVQGHFAASAARIAPATGIKLYINTARFGKIARVTQQPDNKELQWSLKGDYAEIAIPAFSIHTFVVLDK